MRARNKPGTFKMTADEWFQKWVRTAEKNPFQSSGHLLPQWRFVPPSARIFKFETELDQIVPYLDEISGSQCEPRALPHVSHGSTATKESISVSLQPETIAQFRDFYRKDYETFGYEFPT